MTFITIILSVFIVGLAPAPCSDEFNSEHQEEISCSKKRNHSEDTDDSCHSICVCSCCEVTIARELLNQYDIAIETGIISNDDCIYQSDSAFNFLIYGNHLK